MITTAEGSKVVDRATAEEGAPGLDRGMPAVILAQVAVVGEPRVDAARDAGRDAGGVPGHLGSDRGGPDGGSAPPAENPPMSEREVELLGGAEALIRRTASGTA